MKRPFYEFGGDWVARLRYRCEQSIEEICAEVCALGADRINTADGPLVWLRRGSSVLGCAHMDWVDVPHRWAWDKKRARVWSPRLDDRAGVFVLLDVLPSLGIFPDLLFTDNEETGRSTAKLFVDWVTGPASPAVASYNWLAQFDRRGDDVVTYDYDCSPDWESSLKAGGFKVGCGSFSDIAALYDLGACGVNIGVGYHHEHSTACFGSLDEMAHNLRVFEKFWASSACVAFPFTKEMRESKLKRYSYRYSSYDDYGGGGMGYGYKVKPDRAPMIVGGGGRAAFDEVCASCGKGKHWIDMGEVYCHECEWWLALPSEDRDELEALEAADEWERVKRECGYFDDLTTELH